MGVGEVGISENRMRTAGHGGAVVTARYLWTIIPIDPSQDYREYIRKLRSRAVCVRHEVRSKLLTVSMQSVQKLQVPRVY